MDWDSGGRMGKQLGSLLGTKKGVVICILYLYIYVDLYELYVFVNSVYRT